MMALQVRHQEKVSSGDFILAYALYVTSQLYARGHQLPKKVYGFRNLWISSKDFTDFS